MFVMGLSNHVNEIEKIVNCTYGADNIHTINFERYPTDDHPKSCSCTLPDQPVGLNLRRSGWTDT